MLLRWHADKLCLFHIIGFYGFLAGNKVRTKVLPLLITRARTIYWSANLRAKLVHCIGSLPPIKYQLSAINLHSLFFRASMTTLRLLHSICYV